MALSFCNAPRYIESDMFPGKKRLNAKQISTNPKQQTIELKVRKFRKGTLLWSLGATQHNMIRVENILQGSLQGVVNFLFLFFRQNIAGRSQQTFWKKSQLSGP